MDTGAKAYKTEPCSRAQYSYVEYWGLSNPFYDPSELFIDNA